MTAASAIPASYAPRVLIVDDEPTVLRYVVNVLSSYDYIVETASSGREAIQRLKTPSSPDLVIMDMLMPDQDGITTLRQMRELRPGLAVIMLSCVSETRRVVEAMKSGARDYITKPFTPAELEDVVAQCLNASHASGDSEAGADFDDIEEDLCFISASPAMRKLKERAQLVAKVDVSVLITGESGTGKEVIARYIHKLSPRSKRPLLKVNCAAVPGELLESEMFGYEAGAFTGANGTKPGKFEQCNKGTILLDEIGEMPPLFQAKLLQVLQDRTFSRLGSRTVQKADVRILAATNIDVKQALAAKTLREDLYYRLDGMRLHIPPLRDRREEIPVLLKHYLARYAEAYACAPVSLTSAILDACMNYPWPGNVRELCNFVKRALVLRDEKAMLRELRHNPVQSLATEPPAVSLPKKHSGRFTRVSRL